VTLGAEIAITLEHRQRGDLWQHAAEGGTSQKIALNTLSSAIMVRPQQGLRQPDGRSASPPTPSSFRRAISLTMRATGTDEDTARRTLGECGTR
jgi:N-acetylmuramic acid 6-phosphate etherase